MANAGTYRFNKEGKISEDTPWMLSEFINKGKRPKLFSLKASKWLEERGMYYGDENNEKNYIGKYIVDVGGMVAKSCKNNKQKPRAEYRMSIEKRIADFTELIENSLRIGLGTKDMIRIIEENTTN